MRLVITRLAGSTNDVHPAQGNDKPGHDCKVTSIAGARRVLKRVCGDTTFVHTYDGYAVESPSTNEHWWQVAVYDIHRQEGIDVRSAIKQIIKRT